MAVTINWTIPSVVKNNISYDKIRILKGSDENDVASFSQIDEIQRIVNNTDITTYTNLNSNSKSDYYIVRYYNSGEGLETKFFCTVYELTPREQRLVDSLRSMLDPIITSNIQEDGTFIAMSDTDLMLGINLALSWFNMYSPSTEFRLTNFPGGIGTQTSGTSYEMILLYLAQVTTLLNKFVGLSIRDFSYNDNGISINQQFSPAIRDAISQTTNLLNPLISLIKLDFASDRVTAIGTLSLPISIGGRVSKGVSNILNVFNAFGR